MRRRSLLTQVLLVNLLLIAAATLTAAIASNPQEELRDTGAAGLVLGFALAATVTANVFLLARRVQPLERLAQEMEEVELAGNEAAPPHESVGGAEEVQRLERSFRQMLVRLEAERRQGAALALEAQERERRRVARDLHDEVNQALTALVLRIGALRRKAPAELSAEISETAAVANRAMEELLGVARALRPTALDDLGLEAALADLVAGLGRSSELAAAFDCEVDGEDLGELGDEAQLVIYRVAQEAASNAVRHSDAGHLRVRLLRTGAELELRVSDDGRGIGAGATRSGGGFGLAGMRERALLVGGTLGIDSGPGEGTRVRLRVPAADTGSDDAG